MAKNNTPPSDRDICLVWQKLAQVYQVLNEVSQELKRLAAVREKEEANGNR